MHDVARVAQVSHQTVSRVLNDHPHVRPDTKERVQQAIAELGYRRNAAARSLVTRRSGVIGVLTPRTELYGPTSSMIAVEVAAREAGYFVSLASVADTSAAALGAAVEHFKDQAAEAVVLIAPEREWLAAARIVAADMPVVTMCADFRAARPSLATVALDNRSRRPPRHAATSSSSATATSPSSPGRRRRRRRRPGSGRGATSCARAGLPAERAYRGRLELGERLRRRASTDRRRGSHGGVRGERPDGPRRALGARRGGLRRARRRLRRRLRRRPRLRLLHAGADDRAPGLRGPRRALRRRRSNGCCAAARRPACGSAPSSSSARARRPPR